MVEIFKTHQEKLAKINTPGYLPKIPLREIYVEKVLNPKVKEFHELRMGSMTMDAFINRFLNLLHYVPYIK